MSVNFFSPTEESRIIEELRNDLVLNNPDVPPSFKEKYMLLTSKLESLKFDPIKDKMEPLK